jgi:hypothetical protein
VASVLNSKRAVEMSIVESHDSHIRSLFDAIRQLMESPTPKSRRIGFKA